MSPTPTPADLFDQSFIPGSRAFKHAETVAAGLRFHYLHQGTGFPVILLPGFPQSSYAWRKVMPELASQPPDLFTASSLPLRDFLGLVSYRQSTKKPADERVGMVRRLR